MVEGNRIHKSWGQQLRAYTSSAPMNVTGCATPCKRNAVTQDRTGDLQIFSLTLSQLSYRGHVLRWLVSPDIAFVVNT